MLFPRAIHRIWPYDVWRDTAQKHADELSDFVILLDDGGDGGKINHEIFLEKYNYIFNILQQLVQYINNASRNFEHGKQPFPENVEAESKKEYDLVYDAIGILKTIKRYASPDKQYNSKVEESLKDYLEQVIIHINKEIAKGDDFFR